MIIYWYLNDTLAMFEQHFYDNKTWLLLYLRENIMIFHWRYNETSGCLPKIIRMFSLYCFITPHTYTLYWFILFTCLCHILLIYSLLLFIFVDEVRRNIISLCVILRIEEEDHVYIGSERSVVLEMMMFPLINLRVR